VLHVQLDWELAIERNWSAGGFDGVEAAAWEVYDLVLIEATGWWPDKVEVGECGDGEEREDECSGEHVE